MLGSESVHREGDELEERRDCFASCEEEYDRGDELSDEDGRLVLELLGEAIEEVPGGVEAVERRNLEDTREQRRPRGEDLGKVRRKRYEVYQGRAQPAGKPRMASC